MDNVPAKQVVVYLDEVVIALLYELRRTYRRAKVIHVILDDFRIHSSVITQTALASMGGKVVLCTPSLRTP